MSASATQGGHNEFHTLNRDFVVKITKKTLFVCNITFAVFWLSQGNVSTLIMWRGWNSCITYAVHYRALQLC